MTAKRPVGRPPRSKKAAGKSVHLRLTEAEFVRYTAAAAKAGVTVSVWVRGRCGRLNQLSGVCIKCGESE
jgi:hypothetical protein